MKLVAMQKGDLPITYEDIRNLEIDLGYKPSTPLIDELRSFVRW